VAYLLHTRRKCCCSIVVRDMALDKEINLILS
jgi:hypothetical protein